MADLRPANENPWYVLMTYYGEQDGDEVDWELHKANAEFWNELNFESRRLPNLEERVREETPLALAETLGGNSKITDRSGKRKLNVGQRAERLAIFKGYLDRGESLTGTVDLNEVHFEHNLVTDGYFFLGNANLFLSRFEKNVSMRKLRLQGKLSFSGTIIKGQLDLERANIGTGFHASDITLHANLNIKRGDFSGGFDLEHSLIGGKIVAQNADISGPATFNCIHVASKADFAGANFDDDAIFKSAKFGGRAEFSQCDFSKKADFQLAEIKGPFSCSGSTFHGTAVFAGAGFGSSVDFTTAIFSKSVTFVNAFFKGPSKKNQSSIRFDETIFEAPVSFAQTRFCNEFPRFSNTVLPDSVLFSAEDEFWPNRFPRDQSEAKVWKNSASVARHTVSKQGFPEDEHFFFRREMECARQIGGWWDKFPYEVFRWVSDYGCSVARPVICLFVLWFIGALIFTAEFSQLYHLPGKVPSWHEPFSLSFANIFKIFGFQRLYFGSEYMDALRVGLKFLSSVQTILGFFFLFFLGLGLRQRFRLR
ncbi:pentapeptide repeat-containing protein [Algirhabdus cladophorae]|uniref:pentapeptide repeat-containing protein n=1 Tax=Algirhabdus cladophorae TaxID=3377108 RepID=UPI003B848605